MVGDNNDVRYFSALSWQSCFLRMFFDGEYLASGTCFFVFINGDPVLITNRHNFTGRNNFTGKLLSKTCGIPNQAVITLFRSEGEINYFVDLGNEDAEGDRPWIEHPTLGARADVVALPVAEMRNIVHTQHGVDIKNDWYRWDVGSDLSVIGYPFGRIGGPFPIWSKGYIASEPDVDVGGLPVFLIDCKSRPGQSGSPVFAWFRKGDFVEHNGREYQAKKQMNYFCGIYSGRIRSDSDLGIVWKRSTVFELANHAALSGKQHVMNKETVFSVPKLKDLDFNGIIEGGF